MKQEGKKVDPKNTKPPKLPVYWFYGLIAVVLIGVQYYLSTKTRPVETNWSEVKAEMLANNHIDRIVVLNEKKAQIYIKKEYLQNYENNGLRRREPSASSLKELLMVFIFAKFSKHACS